MSAMNSQKGKRKGEGVQVVSVCSAGAYSVCGAALRAVLCRAELRALPVAVLSVAGATRGGKSFLLDFFLRYLTATPSARVDGSWLGAEHEPLGGFSWRGGCERDTLGIQLWSEPFVLTKTNGDKVVVLLMDTQGTFDSCSTTQDSTMIFAMSTLLSSVQIFNISMNIQEDHLQYLQLFTEYGKLAAEKSETPFQVLQFLVRDWSYAYQHPLGAAGGQQLLEKRLQINDNQPEELREIRQHIQSCFESVRCFLMPHPGLTVANSPNFNGCLEDISKEFKDALLELVKGLFDENLTLKKINGEFIQAQELVEYFESYMEVFNSGQLPTPITILQATSSACLEAALNAARDVYVAQMDSTNKERSVPRSVIPRLHAAAKEGARQAFLARRTLAAPERAAQRLDRLLQEIDYMQANYFALNDIKVKAAIAASIAAYEKYMLDLPECQLECELEERHQEAVQLAIALFDDSRQPHDAADGEDHDEDEDRTKLQDDLVNFMKLHEHIMQRNEAKISSAIEASMQMYKDAIYQGHEASSFCVHPLHLVDSHRRANHAAVTMFESQWKSQESAQNEHRTALLAKIQDEYLAITSTNMANNENAVQTTIEFYQIRMRNEMGEERCLHPRDLRSAHMTHYEASKAEFYRCRSRGNQDTRRDIYITKLYNELSNCFTEFSTLNNERNEKAVQEAHAYYEIGMRNMLPLYLEIFKSDIFDRHNRSKTEAIRIFSETLRRDGPDHEEDEYLQKLINMINNTFRWFILGGFTSPVITIASLIFLRKLW